MKKLIIAASVAAFATAAFAAGEMDFAKVDADGDGQVTMEEATAAGWDWNEEQFAAADTDGNGTLSAEEFAAAAQQG